MSTPWFQFSHHGAVNGVAGSCHELRFVDGAKVLVDCGLFQGCETSGHGADADHLGLDFEVAHIEALLVTHVHIDHMGRIPHLLAAGFIGPIYCPEPSAALLPLVLEDALKIGVTRNASLIKKFLKRIEHQLRPLPYRRWQTVINNSGLKFGCNRRGIFWVLPISSVSLSKTRLKRSRSNRIANRTEWYFRGDLGAPYAPLLPSPKPPYRTDTLMIENTYGDRQHENRRLRRQRLQAVIEKAFIDGGTILIPSFSIGRTQEILYELEGLIHELGNKPLPKRNWQEIQILVDSPLTS